MSFHSYESRIDDDLELLSETLEGAAFFWRPSRSKIP